MDVSVGIVFLWLFVGITGEIFAAILARRARRNRHKTPDHPPTFKLMAWSLEVDAILTIILLAFMILAGLAILPVTLGLTVVWADFIRVYIVRTFIIASLSTTVLRLIVMYSFLKTIEERQRHYDELNK